MFRPRIIKNNNNKKNNNKYSELLFQFPLTLFSAALQGVTNTVPYFRLTATQLSVFAIKG